MSLPTRQLQNLTIGGGMVLTKKMQAQRRRRQREQAERQQLAEQGGREPDTAGHMATILSHRGVPYNLRNLSSDARGIAERGLQSENLRVDYARMHLRGTDEYFALQLSQTASVRIGDPAAGPRRVTCTCEEFKKGQNTAMCGHIYWLYDGLSHIFHENDEQPVQSGDQDSVEQRFSDLHDAIGSRIEDIPDLLNLAWDEASEDVDELIQDMLAVFDNDRLWHDFGDEFYDSLPESKDLRFQELVVRGNLSVTIFALAQHDPIFRDRLRNAVTKDICADDFLTKLKRLSVTFLQRLDNYANQGPRFKAAFVHGCASSIRRIISEILDYRRSERAPLSREFDKKSAELVLWLLDEVCNHNKNIYRDSTWREIEDEDPEEERDCNLFTNLISDPSPGYRGQFFALDYLEELPAPAWRHLLNELERLLHRLAEEEAGTRYLNKLRDLIAQAQAGEQLYEDPEEMQSPTSPADQWRHIQPIAGPSTAAAAGQERRSTGEGRPSQRRRLE